tara:strand:- start:115239 stop:117107 length:1869 start_codon:yes stop_codon:yes gene_type:complete
MEVVFNHYGFELDFIDIDNEAKLKALNWSRYAGAVSWFTDDQTKNYQLLYSKMSELGDAKKAYLCLGYFGFFDNIKNTKTINKLLNKFKVNYDEFYQGNPLRISIDKEIDKKITSFEREFEGELIQGFKMRNLGPKGSTYLKVFLDGKKESSDMVILRKGFGYAQGSYESYYSSYNGKKIWRLNPFIAVEKVFGPFDYPIPDTTTLNGKRIGYIHIDGDGFINRSKENKGKYAGEVVLEKILDKYKVPTGISFINAEIFPRYRGTEESIKLVKEYVKKDYLEFASHTYTHPLSWAISPNIYEKELYLDDSKIKKHKGPITAYKISNYQMTYKKETIESINELNTLIDNPEKKIKTLYWSGSCRPPEGAFEYLDGINNLNGGDSRMDDRLKSYATVYPLSRQVGKYKQIYSSNSNENTYTNLWTGPFNGYSKVVETFRNTGSPIRLKPSNIYYHFYSGDKRISVDALKIAYDYMIENDHNIIYPNHYIEIVKDFFNTRIEKIKENTYLISRNNKNRTLRLEDDSLYPNLAKSKNIIGFKKYNNKTYIHLGIDKKTRLVLSKKQVEVPVMLIDGDGVVDKLFLKDDKIHIEGASPVGGFITLKIFGKNKSIKINKGSYKIAVDK